MVKQLTEIHLKCYCFSVFTLNWNNLIPSWLYNFYACRITRCIQTLQSLINWSSLANLRPPVRETAFETFLWFSENCLHHSFKLAREGVFSPYFGFNIRKICRFNAFFDQELYNNAALLIWSNLHIWHLPLTHCRSKNKNLLESIAKVASIWFLDNHTL